jgi:formamidopyrimidine-DNA glycosylase
MPELPEVEVVRRGLQHWIAGRTVTDVEVLHPRAVRRHVAGADDFAARLTGRRIESVQRRGKFLWWVLDDQHAVVAHLGMSGQLLVVPSSALDEPHLRVRVRLGEGERELHSAEGERELHFVDQRTFGGLAIEPLIDGVPRTVTHIARDPFDPLFDDDDFAKRLRRKQTGLKRALLDQTLVSGIGNIYADESLWRAQLHYARAADRLPRADALNVLEAARAVMSDALDQGGTSFDSLYVDVNGSSGYFSRSLTVYGQQDKPCVRCGTPIRRESFMNRSSYLCPRCQRRPRSPRW